jgi:hypothetical protein
VPASPRSHPLERALGRIVYQDGFARGLVKGAYEYDRRRKHDEPIVVADRERDRERERLLERRNVTTVEIVIALEEDRDRRRPLGPLRYSAPYRGVISVR